MIFSHRVFYLFLTSCAVLLLYGVYVLFLLYNSNSILIMSKIDQSFRCPDSQNNCYFVMTLFVVFFLNLSWMGVYCVYLWIVQTLQISRNITTNEAINWKHYAYLCDEVGIGGYSKR